MIFWHGNAACANISCMPQLIDISDLPAPLAEAIETIVRTYRSRPPQGPEGGAGAAPAWLGARHTTGTSPILL